MHWRYYLTVFMVIYGQVLEKYRQFVGASVSSIGQ